MDTEKYVSTHAISEIFMKAINAMQNDTGSSKILANMLAELRESAKSFEEILDLEGLNGSLNVNTSNVEVGEFIVKQLLIPKK